MANFCIPQFAADSFKKALKTEGITPAKLEAMGDEGRNAFFKRHMNEEDALKANALFEARMVAAGNRETKLLAKNLEKGRTELSDKQRARLMKVQKDGMINWVKGLTDLKPSVKQDMISKVDRLGTLMTPEQHDAFLSDLVEQRLGLGVSAQEAAEIARLAKDVEATKSFATEDARLAHGAAIVRFREYTDDLKVAAKKTELSLKEAVRNPLGTFMGGVSDLGGLAKSVKGSLDNSFMGRQGLKVLFTDPKEWAAATGKSFELIVKQMGKKATSNEVMNALKAEIYSRPNSLNQTYKKMGLDIGQGEEAFPTSLPSRVPLFGRFFKSSEVAFEGTAYRLRADLADKYLEQFEKAGVDISNKEELRSIGKLVNSLTGRGDLGRAEGVAKAVNNMFFSPKFFKANIDFLTAHAFDPTVTVAVKQKAAKQLATTIAGMGMVLYIADAVLPGTVEWDPRSSDFGKLKVGNTTFDLTGGVATYLTLAARVASQSSKSATTGKITKIDDPKAYKGATTMSTLGNFVQNKFSPLLSAALALRTGEDRFTKDPINLSTKEGAINFGKLLLAPIPFTNAQELAETPGAAPVIAGVIADGLGIGTNTYER